MESYLSRYGYLSPLATSETILEDEFKEGLREFQWFFGLNETGVLDEATLETIRKPRCRVPDRTFGRKQSRVKRYAYMDLNLTWFHLDLSYKFYNYSMNANKKNGMLQRLFDLDTREALDYWEEASSLQFKEKSGKTDLVFLFGTYNHGDKVPFDGPGGTLAHAFAPGSYMEGHVHFDDDETWTYQSYAGWLSLQRLSVGIEYHVASACSLCQSSRFFSGSNFLQVTIHEVGHALGLGHSAVENAVMFPTYKGYTPNFSLDRDDIKGIQSLYGKNLGGERRRGKWYRKSLKNANELCKVYYAMDTMFVDKKKRTFVFVGSKFWELGAEGIEKGYPREITSKWPEAPHPLNAALNYNGLTYFFKDDKVWCYSGSRLVSGYPKYMSKVFKGVPSKIDAVFVWNRKLYFFRGLQYWKPKRGFSFGRTKPQSIKRWKGMPGFMTAAFQDADKNYFVVKTHQYFRLNSRSGNVENDKSAPYPRSFRDWWLNCGYKPERLFKRL
ncbi:hypothetical protein RUM43_000921 [Polyplax serrata]|uniref:Peptidase metallopeptidase domain-containing protein n=1 Tax=Polyplax serrata TaxID=468196 RepID=A0AAN8SD19_POLSC